MLQMIQRADDAAKGGRAVYGRRTYFHKTVHMTIHRAVHMTCLLYTSKVQELSTANKTIADLKKENSDNEELQEKITGYETEIAKLKKSAADTEKTYALKEQLSKQGVLDPDYLIYKQGALETI